MPLLNRDPFDRLLVAQAIAAPAILYTADARLPAYSDLIKRVGAP
ncbi:MAG: twitching motility protein PilT [Alphaproteobacteria bacterium]